MWNKKTDWKRRYYELHSDAMHHLDNLELLLHDAERAERDKLPATSGFRVDTALAAIKEFKQKWTV